MMLQKTNLQDACRKSGKEWIVNLVLLLSSISFVFVPVTGDIKVFLASSNQSNYISKDLIVGAFSAWELKSVYARTLMYLLYKIASVGFSYGTMAFEICIKALYLLLIVAGSVLCVRLIDGRQTMKTAEGIRHIKWTIIAFTAMHTASHLQVEMTCAMLSLLSFCIWMNAREMEKGRYLKLAVAGLLIGSMAFYKSVLILMSVSVVMAVFIYCDKKQKEFRYREVFFVAFMSVITVALSVLLILKINPGEITEILNASAYQSTLFSTKLGLIELVKRAVVFSGYNIFYIPVGLLGLAAFVVNLVYSIRNRKILLCIAHVMMWMMPWLFIILSNKYFAYHFAVFIFTGIIELISLPDELVIPRTVSVVGGALLFAFYLVFFSILSPNSIDAIRCDKESYDLVKAKLEEIDLDGKEEVLYLDDGLGAYYLKNQSHSKFYYPLPLQRLGEASKMESTVQMLEEIKQYQGRYITVYESWFFGSGKNPKIQNWIEENYEYKGDLAVFWPSWDYKFGQSKLSYYKLYKRKR